MRVHLIKKASLLCFGSSSCNVNWTASFSFLILSEVHLNIDREILIAQEQNASGCKVVVRTVHICN